jgi:penicillin-binding protein 1B
MEAMRRKLSNSSRFRMLGLCWESAKPIVWKTSLISASLVIGFVFLSLFFYGLHLSGEIEKRFSGRRWSIPSRVFSDTTILYPGLSINPALFYEKLDRLRYRQVPHKPTRTGEFYKSASILDIFLHDVEMPNRRRDGFLARIRFFQDRIETIENVREKKAVPILELEPEEILVFFGSKRERRRLVSIEQVPPHVIHAVLAAEDSRFYLHKGLDPRGILRALYTNLRHGAIRQGGSTITQQLAKNYFLTPEKTISRKTKELLLSLVMEIMYGKDEILEIYLNEIYLGQKGSVSVNGIGEAAYFYFDKPVSELSIPEAATIAGLIRAPNYYSPYISTERSKIRRDQVLRSMQQHGWISGSDLETAAKSPVSPAGYRTYGRKAPYFTDYLLSQLIELYSPEALSSLGFSIQTTLDTQVQSAAEKALERGLARLEKANPAIRREDPEKKLQGAIVVMQPKTGYILAMVGGRDYNLSQFNRITQAERQPGSAFKPFVFLSGLDQYTPTSELSNEPKSYNIDGKSWQPQNYAPITEKSISFRKALAKSVNLAAVDLATKVGLDKVVATASKFQFSTPLRAYPSLALGAFEVVPLELARAYCVFAADGLLPYPMSLREVIDENGKVLQQRHMAINRVTSPAKAFMMSSMLQSVVTEGTASALKEMGISFPVGGKTGTTNDFKDAWFVGYTPDVLTLVWVGFDNGDSIQAAGAAAALPIWADLMKTIPQYVSGAWFEVPPGVVQKIVCSESGELAISGVCPMPRSEFFLVENAPEKYCHIHDPLTPIRKIIEDVRDLIKKF